MKLTPYITAIFASACLAGAVMAQETEDATPAPIEVETYSGTRYAVDHFFFFADGFAPEMSYLEQNGFLRWPFDNQHTGQGTTGRFFYFDNFYIEFLWVDDAEAAEANIERASSDFNERNTWRTNPEISPFGIGLRDLQEGEPHAFGTSEYTAEWMGGNFALYPTDGAQNANEPWTFFLGNDITENPRTEFSGRAISRLEHPSGARLMTNFTIVLPRGQELSQTMQTFVDDGLFTVIEGDEHRFEIELDNGAQGKTVDMRPHGMPVIFNF